MGPKRFKSDDRGKRRRAPGLRGQTNRFIPQILTLPSTYVSETDEEDSNSSGELNHLNNPNSTKWLKGGSTANLFINSNARNTNNRQKKAKVLTLAHLSQIINKRIFSDDFDKESSDYNNS